MKWLRRSLWGFAGLLLLAGLLFWFLPARWALPLWSKRLGGVQLQEVHGLLWDGAADRVVDERGQLLGRAQWQLSRRAVLGKPTLALQFQGPQLEGHGVVQQTGPQAIQLQDMQWRVELGLLPIPGGSWGSLRGRLELQLPQAQLQGGWPLQLEAHAQWHDAKLQSDAGDVAFGELRLDLQGQNGVIGGELHDDGQGPLQVQAKLQLSTLGWRIEATLHPRRPDPALENWLQKLGPPGADGDWHIERRGGLASKT